MLKKDVQVFMVTGEKVDKLYSIFRMKLFQITTIVLLSICIAFYIIINNFVMIHKENLLEMDIQALNEYINEDKAELVYNYIQENELKNYDQLLDLKGIGFKTVDELKKYTYIKGVH